MNTFRILFGLCITGGNLIHIKQSPLFKNEKIDRKKFTPFLKTALSQSMHKGDLTCTESKRKKTAVTYSLSHIIFKRLMYVCVVPYIMQLCMVLIVNRYYIVFACLAGSFK